MEGNKVDQYEKDSLNSHRFLFLGIRVPGLRKGKVENNHEESDQGKRDGNPFLENKYFGAEFFYGRDAPEFDYFEKNKIHAFHRMCFNVIERHAHRFVRGRIRGLWRKCPIGNGIKTDIHIISDGS